MLKRPITYEDFDGNMQTEIFYFNISKPELVAMEAAHGDEGLGSYLERIVEAKDHETLVTLFSDIIIKAYGIKSEDGKRFIKTEQIRLEFSQTAAFNALFMELVTDDNAAAEFLIGSLPRDMTEDIKKTMMTTTTVKAVPDDPNGV